MLIDDYLVQGSMDIRSNGYGCDDCIILNGKYKGNIWRNGLNGNDSRDGSFFLINSTFFDYILEKNTIDLCLY